MSSKKAPKNKHVKNSRLSERKFRELPRLSCADAAALSAASPTGPNRDTANRHHGMPRARIAEACGADSPFDGEVEADESHFGAGRVRGARGRGARGEAIVSGPPKRAADFSFKRLEAVELRLAELEYLAVGVLGGRVAPSIARLGTVFSLVVFDEPTLHAFEFLFVAHGTPRRKKSVARRGHASRLARYRRCMR